MRLILLLLILSTPVCADVTAFQFIRSDDFESSICSPKVIRGIFKLDIRKDGNGLPITIVHQSPDSMAYKVLIKTVLFLSVRNYEHVLSMADLMGVGGYIKFVGSASEVLKLVKTTPVSIGYVGHSVFVNTGETDSDIYSITFDEL